MDINLTQQEQERFDEIKTSLLTNEQVSTVKQAKALALKEVKDSRKESLKAAKDAELRAKEEALQARIRMYEALGVYVDPKTGYPDHTLDNYIRLLQKDKMHFKELRYDRFSENIFYGDEPMTDEICVRILAKTSELCKFDNKGKLQDAMLAASQDKPFHEVEEYLNSLVWDKKKRLPRMFHDYLGAANTKLYGTMSTLWMIAAVKRIFEPGCKFDNIVIFAGAQGIGKSNFCERMAVKSDWYCENVQIGDKDGYQQLRTSWIVNMDEITSLNKKDAATAKSFLTARSDKYRSAYGHFTKSYPRHCIFIGTTNEDSFLKDSTAVTERRYWIVSCSGTRSTAIERISRLTPDVVKQLWAEAMFYYRSNPDMPLYIPEDQWTTFVDDQIKYKTENDSELFEFLDEALNRDYEDFLDDSSLKNQYNGQFNNSSTPKKQDIFTVNSLNKLLSDNRIYTWKGCLRQYAAMRSDEWSYKDVRVKGRVVKGLKRVEKEPTIEDEIIEPEKSLFDV